MSQCCKLSADNVQRGPPVYFQAVATKYQFSTHGVLLPWLVSCTGAGKLGQEAILGQKGELKDMLRRRWDCVRQGRHGSGGSCACILSPLYRRRRYLLMYLILLLFPLPLSILRDIPRKWLDYRSNFC